MFVLILLPHLHDRIYGSNLRLNLLLWDGRKKKVVKHIFEI